MRQKELRIALVCYGGISLAVYMHGVTKELWKLCRASRAVTANEGLPQHGTEAVYAQLLKTIERDHDLRLRVMTDIVAGASAGGINGVFLAQAIHSGQSLDPLTTLWLERADVDVLLDPDARPLSRFAKFWATPIVWWLLRRPGNMISESVAPETREEVRTKFSRLIRSRWFEPPFGGLGFSRLLIEAFDAMRAAGSEAPLLPAGHPLDLFVTATDFKGRMEALRLNSPPLVLESEHRLSIGFRANTPVLGGGALAAPLDLLFAARATASFPGAFPPLQVSEIDALARETASPWTSRDEFLRRILPRQYARDAIDEVVLIDGSVLVNAPFADAMAVLRDRPANREVDRRFVYIDPRPDRIGSARRDDSRVPGFFSVILGSLSSIPREQPVRDNLEALERQSTEMATLRGIVESLRPEVEAAVQRLFGRTLFLDRPTVRRLAAWRAKAQQAAAERAGFAYQGYAELKLAGILDGLGRRVVTAAPDLGSHAHDAVSQALRAHLRRNGLESASDDKGGASQAAIDFFRSFDLSFRIRRLRLLVRRLSQDWVNESAVSHEVRETAREAVFSALGLYLAHQPIGSLGPEFPAAAANVFADPGKVLEIVARQGALRETDVLVDAILAPAMAAMPEGLRRYVLLSYLGFPFYDTVTLPLLRGEGLTEFDPVKVDRISPDDALSIRDGGTAATLRGVEFYNFGAFFSRTYRENDYLWGRLHGAERMIDLLASAIADKTGIAPDALARIKTQAFLAILDEETDRLKADPTLVSGLRAEVEAKAANMSDKNGTA